MVAHQIAPALPWIMEPAAPPCDHKGGAGGYRRQSRGRGPWVMTPGGTEATGIVQRVLLRRVLLQESRSELGARYGYSERLIQAVINGTVYGWLTLPVRKRLLFCGVGNVRMSRDSNRAEQINQALMRLSRMAADMLRSPERFSDEQRSTVASDLYLLSGAWREDAS